MKNTKVLSTIRLICISSLFLCCLLIADYVQHRTNAASLARSPFPQTCTPPTGLIISEFRLRGPNGVNDEFIELYNNTDTPLTVCTADGSSGWAVVSADGTVRFIVLSGTIIPKRAHYLAGSSSYSLSSYASRNINYSTDIPDNTGIALFNTANSANFTTGNRLDAVGFTSNAALYREGAGLTAIGISNVQYTFRRNLSAGTPADTNDNAADFQFLATDASLGSKLGAPGPQNINSPIQRNPDTPVVLLDTTVSNTQEPNRVRDLTSDPANNSTLGTLAVRRRVTNNTGFPVTVLKFRVTSVTTFPPPSGTADLRARTSSVQVVTNVNDATTCAANGIPSTPPCSVTVRGLLLEEPPTQPNGGGYNASLSLALPQPLAAGASASLQFLLGVQQTGNFHFFVNVEVNAPISNINVAVNCNTSALINFRTSVPSTAFVEYGATTSYGLTTIHDTVRFYTEHAIQITGLNANTTYHFRINANSNGLAQSSDHVVTTAASGADCPALPVEVDTRMPDMSGAVEKTVKATGGHYTLSQFQNALNDAAAATGKRIITVDAGTTVTGAFTLPANTDQSWIVVRSSSHASLPEGKRVFPSNASSMFKIVNVSVDPAITTIGNTNHWRFIGAEIVPNAASLPTLNDEQTRIVAIGVNETSEANLPHHIVFDRCYVHGIANKSTKRGYFLNGTDLGVIDNYIEEFHATGSDGQGILLGAIKRVRIINNTLMCGGENMMWGGFGIPITGFVPSDLDYRLNHHFWPLKWKKNDPSYAGIDWVIKNLFELKTSSRALFYGNLMEQWWKADQDYPWVIKQEQNSPSTEDLQRDLTFYKNLTRKVGMGFSIVGRTQGGNAKPDRVWIMHNLYEVDGVTWDDEATGSDLLADCSYIANDTDHARFFHNTCINANPVNQTGGGRILLLGDPPAVMAGFVWKDNIGDKREFGVKASGQSEGTNSLNQATTGGYIFTNNGIVNIGGDPGGYPSGQFWSTSWLLLNFNGGRNGNYRVTSGSIWDNAATDKTDLGADIDGVEGATANTTTGHWPSP